MAEKFWADVVGMERLRWGVEQRICQTGFRPSLAVEQTCCSLWNQIVKVLSGPGLAISNPMHGHFYMDYGLV